MTDFGKIDSDVFEDVIYPNLGAARDDVVLGPTHGIDFGVLDVGSQALVVATDPLSILPALGFERAGALALEVVLADVAVSGIAPTHVVPSFSLPADMTDEQLAATWRGFAGRAGDLDVAVAAGHTARYPGVDYSWVGAATAFGVGDHDDIVRPDGAKPGDVLVITTGPGAEITGLFAALFPDQLNLSDSVLDIARERLDDFGVVEDAMAAVAAGDVHAMHDATEGGIQSALVEMATGAGLRFDVNSASVPVKPGVREICAAVGLDPWHVTSTGTLLVSIDANDANDVVETLRNRGTTAARVGSVRDGDGVFVDGQRVRPVDVDPSWDAFARYSD